MNKNEEDKKNRIFCLKLIVIAFVIFICLYWFNQLVLTPIIVAIGPRESDLTPIIVGYLMPIYAGLSGLATLVIVCTILILNKIKALNEAIKNKIENK